MQIFPVMGLLDQRANRFVTWVGTSMASHRHSAYTEVLLFPRVSPGNGHVRVRQPLAVPLRSWSQIDTQLKK